MMVEWHHVHKFDQRFNHKLQNLLMFIHPCIWQQMAMNRQFLRQFALIKHVMKEEWRHGHEFSQHFNRMLQNLWKLIRLCI